jgi:hypothetical protein
MCKKRISSGFLQKNSNPIIPNFEYEKKVDKNPVFSTKNEPKNHINSSIDRYVCYALYPMLEFEICL